MLVDLGRNDLGRVCEPGSVEVVEFMEVRRYSHIMHLESTVTGTVARGPHRPRRRAGRLPRRHPVRAPRRCGRWRSSTSSRCRRRALYGGVVGYLDFAGDADAAIAIRTALLKDGTAYVQAGGGIVADSDPPTEDQESQNKAAAVVRAVSVAQTFTPLGRGSRRMSDAPHARRAAAPRRRPPSGGRLRGRALLPGLVGGALALVTGAQPWWRATAEGVAVAFTGTETTAGLASGARRRRAGGLAAGAGAAHPRPPGGRRAAGADRRGRRRRRARWACGRATRRSAPRSARSASSSQFGLVATGWSWGYAAAGLLVLAGGRARGGDRAALAPPRRPLHPHGRGRRGHRRRGRPGGGLAGPGRRARPDDRAATGRRSRPRCAFWAPGGHNGRC